MFLFPYRIEKGCRRSARSFLECRFWLLMHTRTSTRTFGQVFRAVVSFRFSLTKTAARDFPKRRQQLRRRSVKLLESLARKRVSAEDAEAPFRLRRGGLLQ